MAEPSARAVPQSNGMAIASMVLGIVGVVVGLIPFMFWVALICGLLALIFGFVGWGNAKRGAPHKGMAVAGYILGGIAVLLGIWGLYVVSTAVEELGRELEKIRP